MRQDLDETYIPEESRASQKFEQYDTEGINVDGLIIRGIVEDLRGEPDRVLHVTRELRVARRRQTKVGNLREGSEAGSKESMNCGSYPMKTFVRFDCGGVRDVRETV